jgi:hypothetical protein
MYGTVSIVPSLGTVRTRHRACSRPHRCRAARHQLDTLFARMSTYALLPRHRAPHSRRVNACPLQVLCDGIHAVAEVIRHGGMRQRCKEQNRVLSIYINKEVWFLT